MGLARGRDLVQRAARQTAAERLVDGRNTERKGAGSVHDPGGFLQGLQALAQLLDHCLKPLETRRDPTQALGRRGSLVHDLF
jgi:hypothetical protein